jgi:hypothetical protein
VERYQRLPYFGTLRETGREEDREIAGEIGNRKRVEAGMN